jgi:hypothetical protein
MDNNMQNTSKGYMIVYKWVPLDPMMGRSFIAIHGSDENLYEQIINVFEKFVSEGKIQSIHSISDNKNYEYGPESYPIEQLEEILTTKWNQLYLNTII